MSTRAERDQARIRCLTTAINSMYCEVARIVQASDDPDSLDEYAHANFAAIHDGDDGALVGLSLTDLTDLIGTIAAMEKLVAMGNSHEIVSLLVRTNRSVGAEMEADLLLYLEAIAHDRSPENISAQATSRVEA